MLCYCRPLPFTIRAGAAVLMRLLTGIIKGYDKLDIRFSYPNLHLTYSDAIFSAMTALQISI